MDKEMQDIVEGYISLVAECAKQWVPIVPVSVERKLYLSQKLFGTCDFCYVGKSEQGELVGVVTDLKTGRYVRVEAQGNSQLAYYACALRATYPEHVLDKVVCYIYQPRKKHTDSHVFTKQELDKWERDIITQSYRAEAMKLHAPQPGDFKAGDHCQYCRAKGICATYTNKRQEQIGVAMSAKKTRLPSPSLLTSEQIANVVAYRKEIEDYLKQVEAYAKAQALAGTPVVGTKLVQGRARRRWRGPEVAENLKAMGVEPYEQKLKAFTNIEKELGKGSVDHLLVTPKAPLQIVPSTDRRPAIGSKASLDFEPYNGSEER